MRGHEFEEVAIPHTPALLRTAVRVCQEQSTAEDLVQETLLRAWSSFSSFRPGSNCKAWLFTIMLNLWSRRRRTLALEPQRIESLEEIESGRQALVDERILLRQVLTHLHDLPSEQRVVLLLSAVEGFTIREIAAMVAVPVGTVASRLARARMTLRQKISRPQQQESSRLHQGAVAHKFCWSYKKN